jgi:type VI secretion system secreted protein VgrG
MRLTTPLGPDKLEVGRFDGTERLGRLFEYKLDLRSEDAEIPLKDVLGQTVTVSVELTDGSKRYFNGCVTDFSYQGTDGRLAVYSATMRPWLWFLSRTADCRIFQEKKAPDIIKEIFADHGFSDYEDALTRTYPTRNYCVQYRETDLDFVSRLMEKEGIYYYFKHEDGKHTLVLADGYSSHEPQPHNPVKYFPPDDHEGLREEDHIQAWSVRQTVVPGQFTLRDFDFEKPKADLNVKMERKYKHAMAGHEIYDYPGAYTSTEDGDQYVSTVKDSWGAQHERAFGNGNVRGMSSGYLFALEDLPRLDQNREYLVVAVTHTIMSDAMQVGNEGDTEFYRCQVEAMDSKLPFRNRLATPRPIVRGPQTATVVGPSGEEIWCDKYGRVKLHFHWDRLGRKDQNSSCWVRVSQLWAGKKWGAIHIPRIGQEVIVSFLEGDPDKPLITGRVYNAENMPPYDLPANQTQSGIMSRSSKQGNTETFNGMRFEDKKGEEEVYIQAQKNENILVRNNKEEDVGNDETITIGNDRTESVGHDETLTVANDRSRTVGGNESVNIAGWRHHTVGGNEVINIGKEETVKIGTHLGETIGGNHAVNVGGSQHETIGNKLIIKAGASITLTCGGASISLKKNGDVKISGKNIVFNASASIGAKAAGSVITRAGSTISSSAGANFIAQANGNAQLKGVMVLVRGTGSTKVKGAVTSVESSGVTQVKGSLVKIN